MSELNNNMMNIQTNYHYKKNYPSFKGHCGCEDIITRLGVRDSVTTETRLFRDYKSIKFAIEYTNEFFKNLKEKFFIVGACSTGEDVYSLKMLMGNKPVKILGFDIGKYTVENAKSGILSLYIPANKQTHEYTKIVDMSTYSDSFLVHNDKKLTSEEKKLKEIFQQNFEIVESKDKLIYKLKEQFRKMFDITYAEFDKFEYKYKKTNKNFEFKTADIRDFKNIQHYQKAQIFTFKNSFYHIVTDYKHGIRQQLPQKETKPLLDKIFKNINKSLNMDGLFIMGEKEHEQKSDINIIGRSLLDNGFLPIRMPDSPYLNIWKKVREIN